MMKKIKAFIQTLFYNENKHREALMTMTAHNTAAFVEANRILREKKAQEFIDDWKREYDDQDPPFVMPSIVSYDEALNYVKENFGFAQLNNFNKVEYIRN